jgi:hypothetical protein
LDFSELLASSYSKRKIGRFTLLHFFPSLSLLAFFSSPLVGVTGFEPVTLRLSSACSNQLSYTPAH